VVAAPERAASARGRTAVLRVRAGEVDLPTLDASVPHVKEAASPPRSGQRNSGARFGPGGPSDSRQSAFGSFTTGTIAKNATLPPLRSAYTRAAGREPSRGRAIKPFTEWSGRSSPLRVYDKRRRGKTEVVGQERGLAAWPAG